MSYRSQSREHHRLGAALALLLCSCGLFQQLPSPILISAGDQPALFLGSEPSAAQIGYLSEHVPLTITGRARAGRVPVRIDGALRTRGYVSESLLALRVQRRGRLRGTPLYVGPNDAVGVLGPEGNRLRVRAQAQLRGRPLGPAYDGSYPREGLAAQAAPENAERPEPGTAYVVPANTVVPLFEARGAAQVCELPAQPQAYEVRVVNRVEDWLAVRAGDGPYLIGWTRQPLTPVNAPSTNLPPSDAQAAPDAVNGVQLPARLASEPGALKRVAQGTKVVFGDAVIGVLKSAGYARVVHSYEQEGFADVFVAADDNVALRGLVRVVDLSELD